MKWYKRTIVLAIGLFLELIFAVISALLVRANGEWVASLVLPYFVPKSPFFFSLLGEGIYLFSALSFALYGESKNDLPKGILLTLIEGASELVFLAFFFELTYEITSFFLATACLLLSFVNLRSFAAKNENAALIRLPVVMIKTYIWTILYCILTLNFT